MKHQRWKKYIRLFNQCKTRNSYPFFSYSQPAMLWDHFSNIAFIDAKTKYRIPYLLDVS